MTAQRIGRYEIVEELGRGAMGVVYKARDPNIARIVALKSTRLNAHNIDPAELLRRSQNEARAAGALNHPHIVTIHDAGEDSGVFYIAMEYIDGATLQQLQATVDLTVEQIVDVAGQICSGLDYAHEHGVVHRDIKPSNIMVNRAGLVKITDFGIAKADSGLTTAGKVLGTPDYMSPEQVKGLALDGRSDLFSLGVMLYELVTGVRPFTGQNLTTIIYKIVHETPTPPREVDARVPPGLSAIVTKALAKSPDERYQTGAELMADLRGYKNISVQDVDTVPLSSDYRSGVATTPMSASGGTTVAATAAVRAPERAPELAQLPPTADVVPASAAPPASSTASAPAVVAEAAAPEPQSSKTLAIVIWTLVVGLLALGAVAATLGYLHRQQRALNEARQQAQAAAKAAVAAPGGSSASVSAAPENAAPAAELARPAAKPVKSRSPRVVAGKSVDVSAPLTPSVSLVNLVSVPPGARILVDGAETGKLTPAQITVQPGRHTIAFAKLGFKPEQTVMDIAPGQKLDFAATLKPGRPVDPRQAPALQRFLAQASGKGAVIIRTQPPGAQIAVEGVAIRRKTPMKFPAPPGRYTVTISLEGYRPITRTVEVQAGKMVQLDEFLQPQ